ncbi:plasmid recombination protein [Alistipes finegoldii]|uniref:plasmid recombination protein n=1 Tax=Alistipes finegoldii TaxID=214856 RepID=UPI003AF1CC25
MHLATYSKGDAGRMLAHYDRSIGERDHIDRDGIVYNLAPEFEGGVQARFRTLCAGLEIGAKTKPLADWVITKPEGYHGDTREFFRAVYGFMAEKVGEDRIVCAYVHLDEPGAEPHMHFAFVPVVETAVMTNDKSQPLRWTKKDEEKNAAHKAGEEKRDSKGTVRYKRVPLLGEDGKPVVRRTATASKLFTKADMAEIHPAIEKHLCAVLGVERVGMQLDEKDREQKAKKTLSKLDHEEYVAVTREIERAGREVAELSERSECLRQEVEELEPLAVTFGESVRTLYKARGDGSRERELEAEESGLRSGIVELERQVQEARSRAGQLERDIERLGMGVRDAGERCERARGRVARLIERLGCIPTGLSEFATAIGRKLGFHVRDAFAARLDWAVGVSADMSRGRSVSREKDAPWKAEHR